MKKVLVPIDFSDNSLNALRFGQQLFSRFEVTFYLFSAYAVQPSNLLGDEWGNEWGNEWEASINSEVESDLRDILEHFRLKNKNIGHHFRHISQSELLLPAVKRLVKTLDIDFILMGTKGAKGLKSWFLGSNAVRVLNTVSECPTIIVPQSFETRATKQVVFSTNYRRPFVKDELQPLLKLVKTLQAQLTIVQIMDEQILTDKQKLHKEALVFLLGDLPHTFHKITFETSETQAIKDYVKNTESDMVSFIQHKQNFFSRLLEEDVIEKISFNSPIPIMVLPDLSK